MKIATLFMIVDKLKIVGGASSSERSSSRSFLLVRKPYIKCSRFILQRKHRTLVSSECRREKNPPVFDARE